MYVLAINKKKLIFYNRRNINIAKGICLFYTYFIHVLSSLKKVTFFRIESFYFDRNVFQSYFVHLTKTVSEFGIRGEGIRWKSISNLQKKRKVEVTFVSLSTRQQKKRHSREVRHREFRQRETLPDFDVDYFDKMNLNEKTPIHNYSKLNKISATVT